MSIRTRIAALVLAAAGFSGGLTAVATVDPSAVAGAENDPTVPTIATDPTPRAVSPSWDWN